MFWCTRPLIGFVMAISVYAPAFGKGQDAMEMLAYPSIVIPSNTLDEIKLKRIVKIFAPPDARVEELAPLIPTAQFGDREKLTLEELDRILRGHIEGRDFRLSGPPWIKVVRPFKVHSSNSEAKRLGSLIADNIEQQCSGDCRNVRVVPLEGAQTAHIPSESIWSIKELSIEILRTRLPVSIQWTTSKASGDFLLWYEVDADIRVYRAKESVPRGAQAGHNMFRDDWASLSSLGGVEPIQPRPSSRTTARLSRGQILNAKHLEAIPDIEFGSIVSIVSRYGSVEIRTQGKALHTAFQGDTAKIESLSSNQTFSGLVAEKDLVVVTNPYPQQ